VLGGTSIRLTYLAANTSHNNFGFVQARKLPDISSEITTAFNSSMYSLHRRLRLPARVWNIPNRWGRPVSRKWVPVAPTFLRATKLSSRLLSEDCKTSSQLCSNACFPVVKSTFSTLDGLYLSTRFAPANAFAPTACWFDERPSGNH
jgi:hypothetical protein